MRVGEGTLDALDQQHHVEVEDAVIEQDDIGVQIHLRFKEKDSGREWVWSIRNGRLTELAQNELDPPNGR